MRLASLLVLLSSLVLGQSVEWKTAPEQCGWWWDYDAAKHKVDTVHKVGGCKWINPEPTRSYLVLGLGDDATAQFSPQDLENARPVIKMCSGITGECEVSTGTAGSFIIVNPNQTEPILTCEPVLPEKGGWNPHVKNCKLENGGILDDVINVMADVHEMERKQWQESTAHLQALADRGLALAAEANKNAMQCSKDFKKFIRSAKAYAKGNRQ